MAPGENQREFLPVSQALAAVTTRRRARKACLSCRARKVRCDVSERGRPCMNYYLDSEACIVTGPNYEVFEARSRRAQLDAQDGIQVSYPPYSPLKHHFHSSHSSDAVSFTPGGQGNVPVQGLTASAPDRWACRDHHASPDHDGNVGVARDGAISDSHGQTAEVHDDFNSPGITTTLRDGLLWDNLASLDNQSSVPGANNSWTNTAAPTDQNPDVVYFYYPFLAVPNLRSIPHQDVNFLEVQGCLKVPIQPFLDELVQQYFLHIHPILPLAMLFASCNFISHYMIRALGYLSIRAMKASYYRRTKLLYDLGSDSSPLSMSQAALLLSFASLTAGKMPNTSWISLAIENAKLAEAHLYASMPLASPRRSILKRVWWCCIIRDRSVGLLMRRPIRITTDHFDFNACPLGFSDFTDEFGRSNVYNAQAKKNILVLVFPLDDTRQTRGPQHLDRLAASKAALRQWFALASLQVPIIRGTERTMWDVPTSSSPEVCHDSIVLYTNLMYMYYHSSRVALCHHEVLNLDILQGTNRHVTLTRDVATISENRYELRVAASSITKCLKELVRLGLARWLPITAIGCTVLPLILSILDIKLSPPADSSTPSDKTATALKQNQLNTLIEVMKTYQPQYDGVDWISEIVRHIVDLAQLDNSKSQSQSKLIDWTDILAFQPGSYLRLALALDLSLGKGRLPQDGHFPLSLRRLFAANFRPFESWEETNLACHNQKSSDSNSLLPHEPKESEMSPMFAADLEFINQANLQTFDTGDNPTDAGQDYSRIDGSRETWLSITGNDESANDADDILTHQDVSKALTTECNHELLSEDSTVDQETAYALLEAIGDGNMGDCTYS
ncbi:hypothetical protein G7046_g5570 [Stylonectria norvegica]|nr:hypothetical protein G7046_g5570 [Stylonectria norvegica]